MISDLRDYFVERGRGGIASSCTTSYHPTGNRQCEQTYQTAWKTIKLPLHHRGWFKETCQGVLQETLHAVRSLPWIAANETPHQQMLHFQRRATLAPLCQHGFSRMALFCFDATYATKAIHCVTRPYCWKPTLHMHIQNMATIEKILSPRQDFAPHPNAGIHKWFRQSKSGCLRTSRMKKRRLMLISGNWWTKLNLIRDLAHSDLPPVN